MSKVNLETVFTKRGKDMTLDEVKALVLAANPTLRAMPNEGKGWAARLPGGARPKAREDAVLAAEARSIILNLIGDNETLTAKLAEAEKRITELDHQVYDLTHPPKPDPAPEAVETPKPAESAPVEEPKTEEPKA